MEKEEFKKYFGQLLKDYKELRGYKYVDLAEEVDYTDAYIGQLANSKVMPSGFMIYTLAKKLRIPSNQLFPDLEHEELEKYKDKYSSVINKAYENDINPVALSKAIDMIVESRNFE